MSNWKTIECNSNLIQAETDKAVLIKLPKSELTFWHPSKCVRRSGKNGYRLSVSYNDSFTFRAFRNGSGQNFKTKIEDRELSASQFENYFNKEVENAPAS